MGWSKESCSKEKEYGEETRREMFQLSPQDEPHLAFSSSSRQDFLPVTTDFSLGIQVSRSCAQKESLTTT